MTMEIHQPLESHRLVSERGVFELDRFLHRKLVDALIRLEQGKDQEPAREGRRIGRGRIRLPGLSFH